MPLGFFGSSGSGVKPQQLSNQPAGTGWSSGSETKDARGAVIRLPKHTVYLERKLAEGGFAIVYLASDKSGRHYALKRQFISDDPRQLEACKRECRIVSCLAGHKNIVEYVDHLISKNRSGVYEYSLLTVYYKNSVLQLMNERLLAGRRLSANEVLSIFCDMCEAVARLHHSQTPVIHRDLKVENVLIDERDRSSCPRYVLCDFGSATTKVLSSDTHSLQFIEQEIQRYTTLSYRAPEMIDLYSGLPIGTKSDIWAMGVMLYKLCYFVLPFGDSALAIQNCSYNFPPEPAYPDELRAIIGMLLEVDIERRPDIFQAAGLAFEAAGRRSPVGNLNKVDVIPLSKALAALRDGFSCSSQTDTPDSRPDEWKNMSTPSLLNTKSEQQSSLGGNSPAGITSVNPRLRPKPSTSVSRFSKIPNTPVLIPSSQQVLTATNQPLQFCTTRQHNSLSSPDIGPSSQFGRLCSSSRTKMNENVVAISGSLKSSAFKPYSASNCKGAAANQDAESKTSAEHTKVESSHPSESESNAFLWNPFACAPFEIIKKRTSKATMDDRSFGKCFDQLPRCQNRDAACSKVSVENMDNLLSSVDESDPFGAAPFHGIHSSSEVSNRNKLSTSLSSGGESLCRPKNDCCDGAGESFYFKGHRKSQTQSTLGDEEEEESDCDQRKQVGPRFCYEHFDGIEDTVSSEGFDANNDVTSDDEAPTKGNEENAWSTGGSVEESLSTRSEENTARPLLEDMDDLEESSLSVRIRHISECPDLTSRVISAALASTSAVAVESSQGDRYIQNISQSLSSEGTISADVYTYQQNTNPFVAPVHIAAPASLTGSNVNTAEGPDERCISFLEPRAGPQILDDSEPVLDYSDTAARNISKRTCNVPVSSGNEKQEGSSRQPHYTPSVVIGNPGPAYQQKRNLAHASCGGFDAIVAVMSPKEKCRTKVVTSKRDRLISPGSSTSSDESPQTDDSATGMFFGGSRGKGLTTGMTGHRKKTAASGHYISSTGICLGCPSPAAESGTSGAVKLSPLMKKYSAKRHGSACSKRNAQGTLDASSFVNSSFQAEDWESRPHASDASGCSVGFSSKQPNS